MEARVSSESKRIKLITLFELFLGLALLVGGIVLIVMGVMPKKPAAVLAGEGLVTLLFGGRGALIANVPSRISKLVTLALIIAIVQIACVAGIVFLVGMDHVQENVGVIVASAVPPILTIVIWILSRGMAKRAER